MRLLKMTMEKINIILPVYNEAEAIDNFNSVLFEVIGSLKDKYFFEVIYVLDKSEDNSLSILKKICAQNANVKLLSLSRRFGHQMSLLAGIDKCDGEAAIMMDSDLQHPPSLIPAMLAEFENGYDIVYTIRQDSADISLLKRLSSKLFYRFINLISRVPINENAADFRLISKRVVKLFQEKIRERNQFLRGLFSWIGFRSLGIPFRVGPRFAGKSKYSMSQMMRLAVHGIISFSRAPLQAAVFVGFIFAFLGLFYATITFIQYFFNNSFPSGWTTLTILISVFSGVQLIFLGIIGEYIAAIFDEVKARPHYIIDEEINFEN